MTRLIVGPMCAILVNLVCSRNICVEANVRKKLRFRKNAKCRKQRIPNREMPCLFHSLPLSLSTSLLHTQPYTLYLPFSVFFFLFHFDKQSECERNAEIIKPIHKTCLIVISANWKWREKLQAVARDAYQFKHKYPQNGTHIQNISININQTKAHNIQNTAHIDHKDLPTTHRTRQCLVFIVLFQPVSALALVFRIILFDTENYTKHLNEMNAPHHSPFQTLYQPNQKPSPANERMNRPTDQTNGLIPSWEVFRFTIVGRCCCLLCLSIFFSIAMLGVRLSFTTAIN